MRPAALAPYPGKHRQPRYISPCNLVARVTGSSAADSDWGLVMVNGRRLLVPIDGSPHSMRALDLVIKRAGGDPKISLVLVNVQRAMPPSLFVTQSMIADHYAAAGKEALAKAVRKLNRRRIKAETLIAIGEPAETIVRLARRKHCGEIVLGSRGLGSLKGLLLGSVTTKVVHTARIPITVVP
jgi:nucleotide-binding universal stress UspA family protein